MILLSDTKWYMKCCDNQPILVSVNILQCGVNIKRGFYLGQSQFYVTAQNTFSHIYTIYNTPIKAYELKARKTYSNQKQISTKQPALFYYKFVVNLKSFIKGIRYLISSRQ